MLFEELDFIPMSEADIPVLVPIMKQSFEDDARLFGRAEAGPDGYDDGNFLLKRIVLPDVDAYKIEYKGIVIGAIMLFVHEEQGDGHLSCVFIDKAYMGHGYGAMAWRFVEHTYPKVYKWTLNTSAVSYRNHCFYINKLGFHVVAVTREENRQLALFQLEKQIRR